MAVKYDNGKLSFSKPVHKSTSTTAGSFGITRSKNHSEVGGFIKNPLTKKPLAGVSLSKTGKKKRISVGFNGKPVYNKEF
jgi:hypothetical protein